MYYFDAKYKCKKMLPMFPISRELYIIFLGNSVASFTSGFCYYCYDTVYLFFVMIIEIIWGVVFHGFLASTVVARLVDRSSPRPGLWCLSCLLRGTAVVGHHSGAAVIHHGCEA